MSLSSHANLITTCFIDLTASGSSQKGFGILVRPYC